MYLVQKCLQCFDAVGWAAGRASGLQKLSDEVLEWLSVWREVQIICMWSSWCQCHPIISCSSKTQNGLPFWYRLTQVPRLSWKKRPLNGHNGISSSTTDRKHNQRQSQKDNETASLRAYWVAEDLLVELSNMYEWVTTGYQRKFTTTDSWDCVQDHGDH